MTGQAYPIGFSSVVPVQAAEYKYATETRVFRSYVATARYITALELPETAEKCRNEFEAVLTRGRTARGLDLDLAI